MSEDEGKSAAAAVVRWIMSLDQHEMLMVFSACIARLESTHGGEHTARGLEKAAAKLRAGDWEGDVDL